MSVCAAKKLYLEDSPYAGVIGLTEKTPQERLEFIKTTNYGRRAYDLDNDVVDHQVVNFEFEGGATGTFTMTAFAPVVLQIENKRHAWLLRGESGRTHDRPDPFLGREPNQGPHGGSETRWWPRRGMEM